MSNVYHLWVVPFVATVAAGAADAAVFGRGGFPAPFEFLYLTSLSFSKRNGEAWNADKDPSIFVFLVKRVPGQGPEQRESDKTVLYLLIVIVTLITYIIIYFIKLLTYSLKGEPSLPKTETELLRQCFSIGVWGMYPGANVIKLFTAVSYEFSK